MNDEKQVLADSKLEEEKTAKGTAIQAEIEARKALAEAAAEAAVVNFVEKVKSRKYPESTFTDIQQEEIKNLVHDALAEFFKSYGLKGKNLIFTLAAVIGALVVIFGGFKTVLGWLGFTYIPK